MRHLENHGGNFYKKCYNVQGEIVADFYNKVPSEFRDGRLCAAPQTFHQAGYHVSDQPNLFTKDLYLREAFHKVGPIFHIYYSYLCHSISLLLYVY